MKVFIVFYLLLGVIRMFAQTNALTVNKPCYWNEKERTEVLCLETLLALDKLSFNEIEDFLGRKGYILDRIKRDSVFGGSSMLMSYRFEKIYPTKVKNKSSFRRKWNIFFNLGPKYLKRDYNRTIVEIRKVCVGYDSISNDCRVDSTVWLSNPLQLQSTILKEHQYYSMYLRDDTEWSKIDSVFLQPPCSNPRVKETYDLVEYDLILKLYMHKNVRKFYKKSTGFELNLVKKETKEASYKRVYYVY